MSMAAMRMQAWTADSGHSAGLVPLQGRYILAGLGQLANCRPFLFRSSRHPTMNRRNTRGNSILLARRARELKRHLDTAIKGDDKGVHQSRVASRRLREAVPVLTAGIKGSRAGKAQGKIRRLTKALGTVRELDVTLQIVDEFAARDTLPRLALEEVRAHVVLERDERRAVMLKRLEQVNVSKLERRLASVTEAVAQSDSEEWRSALGSRLLKRSKALAVAMTQAGRMYSPEQLHQVRIAAKKLRYAMELAVDAGIKSASGPVRIVKRTQDTLGRLHDLQVLQRQVAEVQTKPLVRRVPNGSLDIVARALEDQCRHLHARYVASIAKLADVLDAIRSTVVPQLAHRPRGGTRALKMTLKDRPAKRGIALAAPQR
jgi:CHAD domain-containing protein